MEDKYAEVDSSVDKADNCVGTVSMFACALIIIWMFVRFNKLEDAAAPLESFFLIALIGCCYLFSLWIWRRFADLMVRTLEMTKVTAENTAKLVELMSADKQRGLKRGKIEPPAPS